MTKPFIVLAAVLVLLSAIGIGFLSRSHLSSTSRDSIPASSITAPVTPGENSISDVSSPREPGNNNIIRIGSTPQVIAPSSETSKSVSFVNYGLRESKVDVPTYVYNFDNTVFNIPFNFVGDDKYGHLHFTAEIQAFNTTGHSTTIGTISSTDDSMLSAVYAQQDDIIFVWDSFNRSGAGSTPKKEGLIIYNTVSGSYAAKEWDMDDGNAPEPLADSLHFVVSESQLFVIFKDKAGAETEYLLQDGKVQNIQ